MSIAVKNDYIRIEFPEKFNLKAAMEMVNKIAQVYSISEIKLNRFFDLSKNETIELDYHYMSSIVFKIRYMKCDVKDTKSVFLVKDNIQFGFVRMFQTMVADQGMHVGIFFNEEDAINWITDGKQEY